MADTETIQPEVSSGELKTVNDAADFSEYEKIKRGDKVEKETPAEPPAKKDGEPEPKGESAEPRETPEKDNQEKPKRDKSFDGRISELTAARRKAEQERDDVKRELEQLRTAPKPAEQPKPAALKPDGSADDAEPDFDSYVAQAVPGGKFDGKNFQQVTQAWQRDWAKWNIQQTQAAQARESAETQQRTAQERAAAVFSERLAAARDKHSDFDATANSVQASKPALAFFANDDDGLDVLHYLGTHPDEMKAINELSEAKAIRALSRIADKITSTSPETPKPKPSVSRIPPPPKPVSGTGSSDEENDLGSATDFADYERRRKKLAVRR